jgi:hypothetical protein
LSKFAPQNVVIWGDAGKPLRTAKEIFYVGIGISFGVYVFVYFFAIICAFVKQKKYEEETISEENISEEGVSIEE